MLAALVGWAGTAEAQQPIQQPAHGFALERLYLAPAGAGWLVMDDLTMHGTFGGGIAVTGGYAKSSLTLAGAGQNRLAAVSDQAFLDYGFTVTYERLRLSLNLSMPLLIEGQTGSIGGYAYTGNKLDLGTSPDTLADPRIGVDLRLLGEHLSPFRLGMGLQLYLPNGNRYETDPEGTYRNHYFTDDTFRAVARLLFAGDEGALSYAGHLGVHLRPLDEPDIPGSPRGSELLFGLAAGGRVRVHPTELTYLVLGPEVFGATPFKSPLGKETTALEVMAGARLEGLRTFGPTMRIRLAGGGGLNPRFGAPEWRAVAALEAIFGR